MHYMLIYTESAEEFAKREDPEASGAYWAAWSSYIDSMAQAGLMVSGNGLLGAHTATTVRLRDGKREVHDGPFADLKEQLGGYVVIDVPDIDTAIVWAEKAPAASAGSVEIRPVMPPPPQGAS